MDGEKGREAARQRTDATARAGGVEADDGPGIVPNGAAERVACGDHRDVVGDGEEDDSVADRCCPACDGSGFLLPDYRCPLCEE
jgi:hypothetical protein